MKFRLSLLFGLPSILLVISLLPFGHPVQSQEPSPVRRVNVPHDPELRQAEAAIFWFGEVTPTNNYADVRVTHNDELLQVSVQIFDQWLWYDANPTPATLEQWDAASIYLNLNGNNGGAPGNESYRFVAQLNHHQPRADYQVAYQGNGTGWTASDVPFESGAGWRGEGLNDGSAARGWNAVFQIPFASLGLAGPPATGNVWGLAVAVHDRDDAAGTPIPEQTWPESLDTLIPSTWGQLRIGLPTYTPPDAAPTGTDVIRHDLNGATVVDAHVGGHTTCAQHLWPDFFATWGDANYAGYEQFNIQNQWDVADWPCFSKYYVTFPVPDPPPGNVLLFATLSLYQFGNSGAGWDPEPQDSLIQVLAISNDWDESTITWNNAPLSLENISATWVGPLASFPGHPGVKRQWDVSRVASAAYGVGAPLRLAFYSADTAIHSGKYFVSSDTGEWNAEGRPALRIIWGDPGVPPELVFLPLLSR